MPGATLSPGAPGGNVVGKLGAPVTKSCAKEFEFGPYALYGTSPFGNELYLRFYATVGFIYAACESRGLGNNEHVGKILGNVLHKAFRRPLDEILRSYETAIDHAAIGMKESGDEVHSLLAITVKCATEAGKGFVPWEASVQHLHPFILIVLASD